MQYTPMINRIIQLKNLNNLLQDFDGNKEEIFKLIKLHEIDIQHNAEIKFHIILYIILSLECVKKDLQNSHRLDDPTILAAYTNILETYSTFIHCTSSSSTHTLHNLFRSGLSTANINLLATQTSFTVIETVLQNYYYFVDFGEYEYNPIRRYRIELLNIVETLKSSIHKEYLDGAIEKLEMAIYTNTEQIEHIRAAVKELEISLNSMTDEQEKNKIKVYSDWLTNVFLTHATEHLLVSPMMSLITHFASTS